MHRFFIPRPYADEMEIDGIDARHIYTVLKMKSGEKVQIVSDDGVTAVLITQYSKLRYGFQHFQAVSRVS